MALTQAVESYDQYTDDALKPVDADSLSNLHVLAADYLAADKAVVDAEAVLQKAKAVFEDIEQKRIPDFLEEHGLPEFKHTDPRTGAKTHITLKDTTVASIPAPKRDEAFKWFDAQGKGGIIARTMEIDLGKADKKVLAKLQAAVKKATPDLECTANESIHAGTLSATVRQMLRDGVQIPNDLITVTRLRKAKVVIS